MVLLPGQSWVDGGQDPPIGIDDTETRAIRGSHLELKD